jgi:hypothetical protein
MEKEISIYEQLKAAGVPIGSHESDLYAKVTPESTKIIDAYKLKSNVTTFISNRDDKPWYDIPFAYDPFWEYKTKRAEFLKRSQNGKS